MLGTNLVAYSNGVVVQHTLLHTCGVTVACESHSLWLWHWAQHNLMFVERLCGCEAANIGHTIVVFGAVRDCGDRKYWTLDFAVELILVIPRSTATARTATLHWSKVKPITHTLYIRYVELIWWKHLAKVYAEGYSNTFAIHVEHPLPQRYA